MHTPRWILACAAAAAMLVAPAVGRAQTTTGSITGTVTDPAGAAVDAAQVQVINRATGITRGAMTNDKGRYTVLGLEVGSQYAVTVRRIGYAPQTKEGVTVTLSQATRVDFVLQQAAAVLSAVRVKEAAPSSVISPTHTGVTTTITDSALHRLPTLNRNFTDFLTLTPQVSTTLFNGGPSGGGVNNRFNNITIDGANETDMFGLGSSGQPGGQANGKSIGIESVKEYQIQLTPFDVRQGNFSGLLINAVTKSGTNDFQGLVYGVTRNQGLARSQPYINNYEQTQYGFSLGGPIVKDKAFFFINPEFQRYTTPARGIYLPGSLAAAQTAVDSNRVTAVQQFDSLLRGYGLPVGSAGLVNNQNPLANVFGRLDFNLPYNSSLILSYNYANSQDDIFSRGSSGNSISFPLSNNGYQFQSKKNSPRLQLRTNFQNGAFNEFIASLTSIRDRRAPNAIAPQVQVDNTAGLTLIDGSERFSQGNELDQDEWELTDNYTHPFGAHKITVGTQNLFYKVRNLFTQASYGVWNFRSLDSLAAGNPYQYIVGVPLLGGGAVRFHAAQYAFYAQDQWTVTNNFNLTYGLRADVADFSDTPPYNAQVDSQFNVKTNKIPSGRLQYSPRIGFNWDVTGDQRNQLRGGVGVFVGHPAYVWLSNAFQNSGLTGVALLTCNGRGGATVPTFSTTTIQNPPAQCGTVSARAGSEIDLLSPDLRFPQWARWSLGYDRAVGDNYVVTLEGLYSNGMYNPYYRNIALAGPIGTDVHGRVMYGPQPFADSLKPGVTHDPVLLVSNESSDWSYQLTGGITRRFTGRYEASLFYTYSQVRDVMSLSSSTAFSQFRFGRTVSGNENSTTPSRSAFEQTHRIVAQGTYTFPTHTDLSVIYQGQSGSPYTFIYSSDLNGDGFSLNDPIYVPKSVTDTNEIIFAAPTRAGDPTVAQQQAALEKFIKGTPCLDRQRGHIMGRNTCTGPWENLVNLSIRQKFPTARLQNVALQLDVFNFMNLLNPDWGHQGFISNPVTLLSYAGLTNRNGSLATGNTKPIFRFDPSTKRYDIDNIDSNYQLQLSLRYSF